MPEAALAVQSLSDMHSIHLLGRVGCNDDFLAHSILDIEDGSDGADNGALLIAQVHNEAQESVAQGAISSGCSQGTSLLLITSHTRAPSCGPTMR